MMKRWFCTSSALTPISVRLFPPLAKGGQGGWSRRNHGQVRGSRAAGPCGIADSAEHVRYALSTPPAPPSQQLFFRVGLFDITGTGSRAQIRRAKESVGRCPRL